MQIIKSRNHSTLSLITLTRRRISAIPPSLLAIFMRGFFRLLSRSSRTHITTGRHHIVGTASRRRIKHTETYTNVCLMCKSETETNPLQGTCGMGHRNLGITGIFWLDVSCPSSACANSFLYTVFLGSKWHKARISQHPYCWPLDWRRQSRTVPPVTVSSL